MRVKRPSGKVELFWRCSGAAKKAGYQPRYVRLHEIEDIEAKCRQLHAEQLAWLAQRGGASVPLPEQMTIGHLFELYRTRPSSPYQAVKWNSRRSYDQILQTIEEACGDVRLKDISMDTLFVWFQDARYPEGKNGPDRLRKASAIITMLRMTISFGVAAEVEECLRLQAILSNMRFKQPVKRTEAMTARQARALVDEAIRQGRLSIALGTALQFECGLRQRDVIGEWEPFLGQPTSRYVIGRRQWVNGLTWQMIENGVLSKQTTKTGAVVSHDLTLCPLVCEVLAMIPKSKRAFGPVIVSENTGKPYAQAVYGRTWRQVADAAGLPRTLWNMDARSGAATEASDAGAALGDTRAVLGHADEKMTARYVRGDSLEKSRRVAKLRLKHRTGGNGNEF